MFRMAISAFERPSLPRSRPATDRKKKEENRSQLNERTTVDYLIGARHVIPRLHTAGFGPASKGKERRAHPKSQSEGREGLWPIIIHATATFREPLTWKRSIRLC